MPTGSPVVCPRCSSPFECGIDSGDCWCRKVTVSPGTRAAFAQYYDGCLCEQCLVTLERGRPPVPSVREFLMSQLRRKRRP